MISRETGFVPNSEAIAIEMVFTSSAEADFILISIPEVTTIHTTGISPVLVTVLSVGPANIHVSYTEAIVATEISSHISEDVQALAKVVAPTQDTNLATTCETGQVAGGMNVGIQSNNRFAPLYLSDLATEKETFYEQELNGTASTQRILRERSLKPTEKIQEMQCTTVDGLGRRSRGGRGGYGNST